MLAADKTQSGLREALRLLYVFNTSPTLDGMIEIAERAISAFPQEGTSWLYKALLCHKAGRIDACDDAMRRLLEMGPFASDVVSGHSPGGLNRCTSVADLLKIREEPYCFSQLPHRFPVFHRHLTTAARTCAGRAAMIFNPELSEFTATVEAGRQGDQQLADRLAFLFRGRHDLPAIVAAFLEAVEYERGLDCPAVEAERNKLVTALCERLKPEEIKDFLVQAGGYRLGSITHSAFYEHVHELVRNTGLPIDDYPVMRGYLRYTECAGMLIPEQFMGTVWDAEVAGFLARTVNEEERFIILEMTRIYLIERLFDYLSGDLGISQIRCNTVTDPDAIHRLKGYVDLELRSRAVKYQANSILSFIASLGLIGLGILLIIWHDKGWLLGVPLSVLGFIRFLVVIRVVSARVRGSRKVR